jgi:hypothetical protein
MLQDTYMPTVASIARSDHPAGPSHAPTCKRSEEVDANKNDVVIKPNPVELQMLFLPSKISTQALDGCHAGLDETERKLQDAQCCTSLDGIHTHLYLKSGLMMYKQHHVWHQGASTRMCTTSTQMT